MQLYRINEDRVAPLLDIPKLNLIIHQDDPTKGLTKEEAANYTALKNELDSIQNSETQCPGDGNVDGIVNQQDINNWTLFHKSGSTGTVNPTSSSWYDFPKIVNDVPTYDGFTGTDDLQVIQANLGRTCPPR